MAKNYTIAEVVQIIFENGDNAALADIGKRYPLLAQKVTRVVTQAGADFVDFMSFMPEYISANKINSAIKKMLDESPDTDDTDVEDEESEDKPVSKPTGKRGRPAKAKVEDEDDESEDDDASGSYDYESMNNAKMYKLLGEMGKRKDCKDKYGDLSHESMLKYLKKYGPKAGASTDVEDEDVEDEETGDDYEGKSAVELYKLCKQRKIKAEQKKPAKYYIGLLKKADEEAAAEAEDEEAEDDDWGDDEEEEAPKSKKAPAKKEVAEKPKKAPKKEEPEDEDDEEWDI